MRTDDPRHAPADTAAVTVEPEMAVAAGTDRRRRTIIRVAVLAAVLLAVAGGIWLLGRHRTVNYLYLTAPVTRGPLTVTVTATGNLAPVTQVDIGSEVSGTIQSVEADYNTRVRAGQVLARLNTDKLAAAAAQARAARDAAEARTRDAAATVKLDQLTVWRCSTLRAKNLCSQESLDEAQAALDRAQADQLATEADTKQADAALRVAETDLSKAVIRSPINGIVLIRSAEPGQTVAASFQSPVLFTLAQDLTHMELDVDVDEADIGTVKAGEPASFTVDAYPNRTFPAELTQVRFGPKTVQGVVTYQAVLMVNNRDLSLRPGMTATANIIVRHLADVLLIPNTALRFEPPSVTEAPRGIIASLLPHAPHSVTEKTRAPAGGNERDIWVLQDGRPSAVRVTLGVSDGTLTQVLAGELQPGMPVITDATGPKS